MTAKLTPEARGRLAQLGHDAQRFAAHPMKIKIKMTGEAIAHQDMEWEELEHRMFTQLSDQLGEPLQNMKMSIEIERK